MANDQKCGACCKEESPVPTQTSAHSGTLLVFSISNMDCPTEEKLIRKHLEGRSDIEALQFNLMERKLTVTTALSVSAVQSVLQEIGMQAVPATIEGGLVTVGETPEERSRITWWRVSFAGVLALLAEGLVFVDMARRCTRSASDCPGWSGFFAQRLLRSENDIKHQDAADAP